MKKILITGANGLLGQKLVDLLTKQPDVDLIATARGDNRLPFSEGYTYRSMDITDRQQVLDVISEAQPDVVIHGAAMTDVDKCEIQKDACWAQNVHAVEYIVEACRKVNAFLVHVSTDFIFDGADGPYAETAEANPISFYGWSKQAGESVVKHADRSGAPVRWAIARTVLVYGIAHDMSRSNIILWVKKSLEEGKTIKVVTDQWRSPTLAEDLAMGCYLIADQEAEGIFNISGKEVLTPYEMAIKTADYFNLDKSLITQADASTFTQVARRPPRTGFVLDKARTVLGYDPHTFEEGIAVLASQLNS
ncbi:NAD(P)-dependent oxidoreductase [Spirosoma sp. KCTC 42546]|uniref:SDR family oxidoreductase n=1 Tax=Spirosoma sp. KCTC 42546 TaxID=2520506 RepID=UPI001157D573|nr:NAD(P)-dependent oxidoreductase [Spirosoma sp. KCTC 42546]QDK83030.1 NAD(P)-dependent oxidoreductase [Spirosoma sp. KCTC 42546]